MQSNVFVFKSLPDIFKQLTPNASIILRLHPGPDKNFYFVISQFSKKNRGFRLFQNTCLSFEKIGQSVFAKSIQRFQKKFNLYGIIVPDHC